jgi:monofunctional biosynthetic peptidoglycan transglycosylase
MTARATAGPSAAPTDRPTDRATDRATAGRTGLGRWARRAAWAAAAGLVLVPALALACAAIVWITLPSVDGLVGDDPRSTSFLRRRAAAAGARAEDWRPAWVALGDASPLLVCAVVKAEDRGFFRHGGLEWSQLRKAAREWLGGDGRMGGSTITQQLARNLYLGPERTVGRKLREALLARRLERVLGKRRILEIYLNVIEWGDGVWGMERAARAYFGQGAGALDAFQASFLASLIAAPSRPLQGPFRERAERTQRRVLHQLYLSGVLDAQAWRQATGRMQALHAALSAGTPLPEALRRAAAPPAIPPRAPPRREPATIPPGQAVARACGLDREVAETEAFRAALRRAHR